MRTLVGSLIAAAVLMAGPTHVAAATLTLQSALTVNGTDVFSGPTIVVPGVFTAGDALALTADGVVDLAGGAFTANAAGIVVAPPTTNTGVHPGQTSASLAAPHYPYAALLVGNATLGFVPFFSASAANGLGDPTPVTHLIETRTFADLFGAGFAGLAAGDLLEFRVNDINNGDNSGAFRLSAVPEPASLLLLGAGLAASVARRRLLARG